MRDKKTRTYISSDSGKESKTPPHPRLPRRSVSGNPTAPPAIVVVVVVVVVGVVVAVVVLVVAVAVAVVVEVVVIC